MGKPLIYVSINYRLNTFGFLASARLSPSDLNAGFQDQQLALRFVHDNIAAFGGDPDKVTLWGQSSGGGSVKAHFLYPLPGKPLFRAGIANSDTGPFKNSPDASTYDKAGMPFDRLLHATRCARVRDKMQCLKEMPFQTLLNISNTMIESTLNMQLWEPAIGPPGSVFPERAFTRMRRGDFLHLPYMAGTNLNEGTRLSIDVYNLSIGSPQEDAAFDSFVARLLIDNSTLSSATLEHIRALYPASDMRLGGPYHTGDSLFDRAAAWYGDEMYLGARRLFFDNAIGRQPLYAYHYQESIPGRDAYLGVAHGWELPLIFGPVPQGVNMTFADQLLDYYVNFVNDMEPGGGWKVYSTDAKSVLQLRSVNLTMIPDDWDKKRTEYLWSQAVLDEFEK